MSLALLNIHRRTELWGPDAAEFDPERWLDDRMRYYKANPFIFTVSDGAECRWTACALMCSLDSPSRRDRAFAWDSSSVRVRWRHRLLRD